MMPAEPLPRQRAWQAVLVVTGLASLIRGAHGEYWGGRGTSWLCGEEKKSFSQEN